jgi:hypothetical protein
MNEDLLRHYLLYEKGGAAGPLLPGHPYQGATGETITRR